MRISLTEFPYLTEQGDKEINQKDIILTPQLRQLLNLIDGSKTARDLLAQLRLGEDISYIEQLISLGLADVSGSPRANDSSPIPSIDLKTEVGNALVTIFGKGILKEIEKVAKANPPDFSPLDFLDACKAKAAMLLSDDEINAIFNPLYEQSHR